MKRLAIITTHPIQYNAPWFRLLAERKLIYPKVFYTWSQVENEEKFDPGFGKVIDWDIPLLEGYEFTFVENKSKKPGSKTYRGIDNPSLISEVEEWQPDAVLIFGWKFKSHRQTMKHFKGKVRVFFRGDSTTLDDRGGLKDWLRYKLLRRVYADIDHALYVGSESKKYFLKAGIPGKKLVFVPHAVDNNRFQASKDIADFRPSLGIPANDLVFLFAGKLEEKKNPHLLLRTFLRAGLTNAHLVMTGNGPLENALRKEFNGPSIHFLDFQNQQSMPSLYQMSDVFVLPSKGPGETWGLAVNEAMAAGKPVLVSDRCGCATDLVEDGVTGFVFRSNDEEDLKAKLILMADNPTQLKTMGAHAQEKIQDWSFDHIVSAIETLLTAKAP